MQVCEQQGAGEWIKFGVHRGSNTRRGWNCASSWCILYGNLWWRRVQRQQNGAQDGKIANTVERLFVCGAGSRMCVGILS